ncbi:MAG TPA: hypothetical protein VE978_02570 [Chitinophagales bacterium]|nr:hypothetical protein [Chitinophagales bacterium]
MALISWLLIYLLGYAVLNSISRKFSFLEKSGFAFPVGIGVTTMMMFLFDIGGLPLNQFFVLWGGIITVLVALFFTDKKIFLDPRLFFSLDDFSNPKDSLGKGVFAGKNFERKQFHAAWVFLIACILAVSAMIMIKGEYWIVFIYDSVAGYDFLGRAIAHEGTIQNSIFDKSNPLYTVRDLYPPLVPLAFAFSYATGNFSSQIVITLFFASTVICFYALLIRFTNHFAAALFTFLLVTIPQLAAFSSLSSGSIPCTFYCPMALLCIYIWYEENDMAYFWLGTLLMVFALWTRSESLAFAIAGGMLVVIKSFRKKKVWLAGFYSAVCFIIFFAWQIYLSGILKVGSEQPMVRHLFFDKEKLERMLSQIMPLIFKPDLYGFTIYIFLTGVLISIAALIRKGDQLALLSVVFLSWILLTGIFYQIDVDYKDFNSLSYITSGYSRAMFYLLPLMLFYVAVSKNVLLAFQRIKNRVEKNTGT